MNVVLTSEHRVGSRWIHYLLADLLNKKPSPEIDGKDPQENKDKLIKFLNDNRIAKYHHGSPKPLIESLSNEVDFKLVGVVRNPRDRGVSRAFHDRYHPKHDFPCKKFDTDFEAVKFIVLQNNNFAEDNYRQINDLMLDGYSTRNKTNQDLPYIWTSYEWMKDDPFREIKAISEFLGAEVNDNLLTTIIHLHSFSKKSGRQEGQELRSDTWRRKGQMLDWINWYNSEMVEATKEVQEDYWRLLIKNGDHK